MPSHSSSNFWTIIPAAGIGSRMAGAELPKQYARLQGRTLIEWSIAPFLRREDCRGVVVALSATDTHWATLAIAGDPRVGRALGGAQRADSVLSGLRTLQGRAKAADWVLVHDAARPCLNDADLSKLLAELQDDEVGGLLACAVPDTLKRGDDSARVETTVARERLWRALTPQMFRYAALTAALEAALRQGIAVTDDSQAIELAGSKPKLVAGSPDNIKITYPDDLAHAQRILESMQNSQRS